MTYIGFLHPRNPSPTPQPNLPPSPTPHGPVTFMAKWSDCHVVKVTCSYVLFSLFHSRFRQFVRAKKLLPLRKLIPNIIPLLLVANHFHIAKQMVRCMICNEAMGPELSAAIEN